jgi:hypothetical protein
VVTDEYDIIVVPIIRFTSTFEAQYFRSTTMIPGRRPQQHEAFQLSQKLQCAVRASWLVWLSLCATLKVEGWISPPPASRIRAIAPPSPMIRSKLPSRPEVDHWRPPFSRRSLTRVRMFNKLFEEKGPLGKGITVGKVQVAVATDPSNSITRTLERVSKFPTGTPSQLARIANEVCVTLLRNSASWVSSCSSSAWYSASDAPKAESQFNLLSNKEAAKFEKVSIVYL